MLFDFFGPCHFLDRVINDLADYKHVVIVLPRTAPLNALFTYLRGKINESGLGDIVFLKADTKNEMSPMDALARTMGLDPQTVPNVDDLFEHASPQASFVMVANLDDTERRGRSGFDPSSESFRTWQARLSELLHEIGHLAHNQDLPPFQLLIPVSPLVPELTKNTRLGVHKWWGAIRQIDIDMVVEQSLAEIRLQHPSHIYWGRSLCRGLAACDPEIARYLLEKMPPDINGVLEVVEFFVEQCPDSLSHARRDNCHGMSSQTIPTGPPVDGDPESRFLWFEGFIDWSEMYGAFFKTRYLAGPDRKTEVERRILNGQIEILFPLVERVRWLLAEWLDIIHPLWRQTRFFQEDRYYDSDVEPDINQIARFASRERGLKKHAGGVLCQTADYWREIRNAIAHCQIIHLRLLEQAYDLLEEARARKERDSKVLAV